MHSLPLPASPTPALLGTVWPGGHCTDMKVGRVVKLSTGWYQETWRLAASATLLQWTLGKEVPFLP